MGGSAPTFESKGTGGGTGPQGIQGLIGISGTDGEDGLDSLVPGPQGNIGLTGATGAVGSQGPMGPPGVQLIEPILDEEYILFPGVQGLQGIQGVQGPAGPQGPIGLPGIDESSDVEPLVAFLSPDNGQYFYLPGRPGGQTGNGGISGSDSLTLNAYASAWLQGNTGRIKIGERITMFPSGLTAVASTLNFINSTSIFTQTDQAANFYAYGFDGQIRLNTAPLFGIPPVLAATNATCLVPSTMSLAAPGAIQANWNITADGAGTVLTLSNLFSSMIDSPSISVTNGGAISNASTYASYDAKMTVTSGVTMGTRQMYKGTDGSGAGTMVGQVFADCPALAKGSSLNCAFRSAVAASAGKNYELRMLGGADNVVKGQLRLGDTTDPTALFDVVGKTTMNTSGVVTKYNNVATVSDGIPSEVATIDLTAQGASIAASTLYAVPAAGAGMYRVSWVATVTRAASTSSVLGGTAGFTIKYTEGAVVKTMPGTIVAGVDTNSTNSTATGTISGCFVGFVDASTTIQYQMDYTSVGVTTMQYSLHLKCEAL